MKKSLKKSFAKKILHSWVFAFLLLCSTFFLIKNSFDAYSTMSATKRNLLEQKEILALSKEKKEDLEKTIMNLSDPREREVILRERYLVAKEGEIAFILIDENEEKSGEEKEEEEKKWWQKIFHFLHFM
jgi:cell division protein FtsB